MEDLLSDVYVEPKLASIGSRLGAAIVDFVILVIVGVGFGSLWGEHYSSPEASGFRLTGLPALAYFAICFLLLPVQEGVGGKTIGMRIMGIRVKRKDLSDAGVGNSIVRHLFDIVDCFCLVGIIVAASNPQRQRVGDIVAGTLVVEG
jgi:uncharacterized RDD family membrane protein YckC